MNEKDLKNEEKITHKVPATDSVPEEIQQQVFDIIEDLCLSPITDAEQTLLDDLSLDSLRMVMLLVTLEDNFEIELDESDMNPFTLITVRDVVDLVMKYVTTAKEENTDV